MASHDHTTCSTSGGGGDVGGVITANEAAKWLIFLGTPGDSFLVSKEFVFKCCFKETCSHFHPFETKPWCFPDPNQELRAPHHNLLNFICQSNDQFSPMSSTEALSGQVRIFFSFLSLHFLSSYIFFFPYEKNIFVCVESCKERKLHEWMEHRKKKHHPLPLRASAAFHGFSESSNIDVRVCQYGSMFDCTWPHWSDLLSDPEHHVKASRVWTQMYL